MKKTFEIDGLKVNATLEANQYGRLVITELRFTGQPDRPVTTLDLRHIAIGEIEHRAQQPQIDGDATRKRLTPRMEGESPEEFSGRVAEAYRSAAALTAHPAALIARDLDAKLPTVHTWIREARLRGLLPAAKQRKAG